MWPLGLLVDKKIDSQLQKVEKGLEELSLGDACNVYIEETLSRVKSLDTRKYKILLDKEEVCRIKNRAA